jgi:hypothetical protein
VLAVNCYSFVRSFDASCWPITCGGKKARELFAFKITQ